VLPPVNAADVSSLRDRLGHDVRSLEPGDDPVSRQAMADASERYSTASTLLERASSDAQLRTAWLAAVEGLAATRTVRQRLGLDLGPPVPSLPGSGEQLTRHARVEVGGRGHVGAPHYEPGRPHYFPGGYYGRQHIPGGWYDAPFWPSALVLGGLAGWTLGGLTAGAMYGEDLGYGMDGGLDGGLDGGGDWSGGAGEWGGGGGDWSGGAGEWGGGGGGWSGGGSDWGGGGGGATSAVAGTGDEELRMSADDRWASAKAQTFQESVIREMSRLCAASGGVNLAQGFPDFACPQELKDARSGRSTTTSTSTPSPGAPRPSGTASPPRSPRRTTAGRSTRRPRSASPAGPPRR
jgi:hypothetical protein